MTGVLPRYVLGQVVGGVCLALAVILTMILLVDFVELTRQLGDKAGPLTLAGFTLLRAPSLIETTFPFIFLFGAMWGVSRLNRRSELVVLRGSGMSAWSFLAPAALFAFIVGALAAGALNPTASRLTAEYERRKDMLDNDGAGAVALSEQGAWLREPQPGGQLVIRAGVARDGGRRLEHVTLYVYENDFAGVARFARRFDAAAASLIGGFWQLKDVWETAPETDPVRYTELALPSRFDAESLVERVGGPRSMDFWRLREQTRILKAAGFPYTRYELRWHRLAATPITLAAMMLVGAAASMRLARRGGAFQLAAVAAIVGFAVYFADNMLAALGSTGALPPFLAAWAAPLLALFGALFTIAQLEDG